MKQFLVGKRISLHGLREQDLGEDKPYFSWMNNLEYDAFTERSRYPNNVTSAREYYEKSCRKQDLVMLGIYDNETGDHIGNVSYKGINSFSRHGHLGYLVGDAAYRGRGIATEAVMMFMYYGFNKLNFNRVHTTITVDNKASIKVAEKVGLIEEGCMREHIVTGDRALDVKVFGALRREWMESHAEKARALFDGVHF